MSPGFSVPFRMEMSLSGSRNLKMLFLHRRGGGRIYIYICVDVWRTAHGAAWPGWGIGGEWAACLMRLDSVLLKVQLFCGSLAVLLEVEPWWFISLLDPVEAVGVTCAAASLKWQWQDGKLLHRAAHKRSKNDKKPEICHFVSLSFSRFTTLLLTVHFIIELVINTQKTCKLIALKMYEDKQILGHIVSCTK